LSRDSERGALFSKEERTFVQRTLFRQPEAFSDAGKSEIGVLLLTR